MASLDRIISECAVLEVTQAGLRPVELAPGLTAEAVQGRKG
jgi:acyl CoA:acetate/3-ketoacid CoA transferase beta subunit